MSAEWVRPGDRIYSREPIDKHGDNLAGLLAEPLPLYGPGPFDILYWQPIRETKRGPAMIVPDKDPFASRDEIDAALGSKPKNRVAPAGASNCTPPGTHGQLADQTMTGPLPNPLVTTDTTSSTRFGKWCSKNDGRNGGLVIILVVLALFFGVLTAIDAAKTADHANDTCREHGPWVQCESVHFRADDIEGVEIIRDGQWGQKELTVYYAGGTEIVQVGAAHLDEALALLDRGAENE